MQTDEILGEQIQKKGRHRKKQLYNSILKQMEFYFSDSNIGKDRFLSQLIHQDPFVDLSTFLHFNKIRKLTSNVEDIIKSLSKSKFLELSEDKAKVRRKSPINIKENVDDCTIYVERLKSDVTHEWLEIIFSEFGKVVYVSIPKYKHNGMIKGFAFIEYENVDEANAALEYFESIDCKIPSCLEPQHLCSIATYQSDFKIEREEPGNANKRKHDDNETEVEGEGEEDVKAKKPKLEAATDQASITETEGNNCEEEDEKKEHKKVQKKKMNIKEIGLRILSKKEWKKMRNRYLDMQRNSMKQLKQHLYKQRFAQNYETKKKPTKNDTCQVDNNEPTAPVVQVVPGTIVKVSLSEPCYDPKVLKKDYKNCFPGIKYVDASLGKQDVYVRFCNNEAARAFCSSNTKGTPSLLEGDEETSYWKTIEENMVAKQKKNSTSKQRGRDKLLKKAEQQIGKHIRFNDNDED